jgi:hypothetical protein
LAVFERHLHKASAVPLPQEAAQRCPIDGPADAFPLRSDRSEPAGIEEGDVALHFMSDGEIEGTAQEIRIAQKRGICDREVDIDEGFRIDLIALEDPVFLEEAFLEELREAGQAELPVTPQQVDREGDLEAQLRHRTLEGEATPEAAIDVGGIGQGLAELLEDLLTELLQQTSVGFEIPVEGFEVPPCPVVEAAAVIEHISAGVITVGIAEHSADLLHEGSHVGQWLIERQQLKAMVIDPFEELELMNPEGRAGVTVPFRLAVLVRYRAPFPFRPGSRRKGLVNGDV